MSECPEHGMLPRGTFRLETGLDVLADWAESADEARKKAVYEALFVLLDGDLLRTYRVIDDLKRPGELFIIVRDDLVLRIRIHCVDSFGIVDIDAPVKS